MSIVVAYVSLIHIMILVGHELLGGIYLDRNVCCLLQKSSEVKKRQNVDMHELNSRSATPAFGKLA